MSTLKRCFPKEFNILLQKFNMATEENDKIIELKQDLFLLEESISLAHCVSSDFHMAKGIAFEFK